MNLSVDNVISDSIYKYNYRNYLKFIYNTDLKFDLSRVVVPFFSACKKYAYNTVGILNEIRYCKTGIFCTMRYTILDDCETEYFSSTRLTTNKILRLISDYHHNTDFKEISTIKRKKHRHVY